MLTTLLLREVALPAIVPPAFANVAEMHYENRKRVDVGHALMLSPSMRSLVLCTSGVFENDDRPAQNSAQLRSLEIVSISARIPAHLLAWLPTPQMDVVRLTFSHGDSPSPAPAVMCNIARHVAGLIALVLALDDDGDSTCSWRSGVRFQAGRASLRAYVALYQCMSF